MNTSLKNLGLFAKLDFDINELVKAASKVIAPYGPITAFAARDPWAGLENQTFEKVARRLKSVFDVDILPNDAMIQAAQNRGEINLDHLKESLVHWLDQQSLEIPREVQEQYCWSLLLEENNSTYSMTKQEIKNVVTKLNRFSSQIFKQPYVQTYSQRLERFGNDKVAEHLNFHIIKWCKLYLDEDQAAWSMPHREEGFYAAWRALISLDPSLNKMARQSLRNLPKEADQALIKALLDLKIPQSQIQDYLEAHLLSLPGWAGMMLWRAEETHDVSLLVDYLAIRILMESALIQPYLPIKDQPEDDSVFLESLVTSWHDTSLNDWAKFSSGEQKARLVLASRFDHTVRHLLWLDAWEKTYEDHLKAVITAKQEAAAPAKQALAQFAFCIDVRSESFRRLLEKNGPFETFGTAGFFNLPIQTSRLGSQHSHSSLPVMLKPQMKVKEALPDSELNQYRKRRDTASSPGFTFETMKHNLVSSLMLPEISGPWLTLHTLASNFVPRAASNAFRKIREKWLSKPSAAFSLDRCQGTEAELPVGFTEEEKAYYVQQALKMMGLTDHFAPLVVICGHESHSLNNPHATALDCSACGGTSSEFNARVLAVLCNLPSVRSSLAKEGIIIPKDTVFVAAKHLTTTDELSWIYVPELTDKAQEAFDYIQSVLPRITEASGSERIPQLPNIGLRREDAKAEAHHRAKDWSEVRPEWGLAGNAAFIIGERSLTRACDLEGRVFLHNYNWKKDKNGDLLANIIKGPATVAQWINLQYYASTVAPHYYGSGNKITQTVTSGIGVMQGNASDLLTGLPWQSVMKSDQEAYHDPIRLLTVIQAPSEYIKRMLDQLPEFRQKVQNGWIRLASVDPDGNWRSWS